MLLGKSPSDALKRHAKIYPMETLFSHLQFHIETIFYKFVPHRKAPQTSHKNWNEGSENFKNTSNTLKSYNPSLRNKQQPKQLSKEKESFVSKNVDSNSQPSEAQTYQQSYNKYNGKLYVPPTNLNQSTCNRVSHWDTFICHLSGLYSAPNIFENNAINLISYLILVKGRPHNMGSLGGTWREKYSQNHVQRRACKTTNRHQSFTTQIQKYLWWWEGIDSFFNRLMWKNDR